MVRSSPGAVDLAVHMVKSVRLFSPKRQTTSARDRYRESPRARGYDRRWDVAAAAYLAANPYCAECENEGFVQIAHVVDHKIPVKCRPDLMMDRGNWWPLCNSHHNGFKRRLEAYAIAANCVDRLILWCDDVTERPISGKRRQALAKRENLV